MRIPIQYAITYPKRTSSGLKPIDLIETGKLTFRAPDKKKFPGLEYCYRAGRTGGTAPAVLNAANEIAVESFLSKKINFTSIAEICGEMLKAHKSEKIKGIRHILEVDAAAREKTTELIKKWN
jgi:1-deoxy-D-xylulose-5-phosphate reductoisomerase